jgi:TPR repeat protein
MTENGIGSCIDLTVAMHYYELSSDLSAAGSTRAGWCWQAKKGAPIDFPVAAEFFKKAADSNDGCSVNSFDCCLECDKGIDENMELAVRYYRKAVSQSDRDGIHDFARCLEYCKGIGRDFIRAAKYDRRSAELKSAAAENSFGICLGRGIRVQSTAVLAVHYYQRSVLQGHPDWGTILGFCLEHDRGVAQDIT